MTHHTLTGVSSLSFTCRQHSRRERSRLNLGRMCRVDPTSQRAASLHLTIDEVLASVVGCEKTCVRTSKPPTVWPFHCCFSATELVNSLTSLTKFTATEIRPHSAANAQKLWLTHRFREDAVQYEWNRKLHDYRGYCHTTEVGAQWMITPG